MAKNYYADAEMSEPAEPASMETPEAPPEEMEVADEGGSTVEIPKAVMGGEDYAPGDTVTLEVVKVMGDTVLVKYFRPPEEEETPPPEAESPTETAAAGPMMGGGAGNSYME